MTPAPFDLPLRPWEAAELANLIFEQAEHKQLTGEIRNRLAARAAALRLETVTPCFGSLARDPVHPSAYYLAVDGEKGEPLLLYLAPAAAPTSSIFHKLLLIGRMRRPNGPEIVINSVPFGAGDHENLEKFVTRIDTAFLPRPQGSRPAIAVSSGFPAAFDAFRAILKRTGKNVAAIAGAHLYHAGLWAAIRAGWREGYTAGVELTVTGGTLATTKEAIRRAAGFSRFTTDTSSLFGAIGDDSAEQRAWILDEFALPFDVGDATYEFAVEEVSRLAFRFGRSLQANEQVHEHIRQTRSALKIGRGFDFGPSLEKTPAPTTPKELLFCLHWLKARGHAAQFVAPNLGAGAGMAARVRKLASVARHYQCILSLRHGARMQPEVLEAIARATAGRFHYQAADASGLNFAAEHLVG